MKLATPDVNFPQMETEVQSFWEVNKIFTESNRQRETAPEFLFYDGPPFANGLPHYGHLLASTVKDVVPRYWTMRGYYVNRRFGWDCHGLPVEFEIEKTHNLKGRTDILNLGVAKFNELCKSSVLRYTEQWKSTISRLGRWVDWDHQYYTMDKDFMESVWWVFSELFRKGLVYRSYKVVPYSPRITAVLSNFEANQNYKDTQDPALTVKFKAADEEAYFLAWTTTPWTLISNLALCVGPDITYVKIKDNETNQVYYLAESRLSSVYKPAKKGAETPYVVLGTYLGKDLKDRKYVPLFPYFKAAPNAFRVLVDDYVTTDDGTGIVHQAPAYGEDDFRVCLAAGIELVDPLDEEGNFRDVVSPYKGQFVKDADKNIIKDLKDAGLVLRHETIVHSYPFCERTDTPLIYRAIPAWYVAVEKIRDNIVANNEQINWVPEHLKHGRMGNWLLGARDWAISRNRFWGTPLPIWMSDKDENHYECIGSIQELEEKTGVKVNDLHKESIDHLTYVDKKTGATMRRIPEVFDCWFESGSMPYAQKHYPFENRETFAAGFPAQFIAEGLDQTRGWFYTLAVLSAALFQKPAFKNVVVNGIVLAEDGRKMSKRWRNYTPPGELIDQYGADSVRLYMLNSAILRAEDLRFSNQGVRDTTRAVLLPLWNAFSFLTTYAAADGWKPSEELAAGKAPQVSAEMDRWILSRLNRMLDQVHQQMEAYRLYKVVPEVLGFIEDLTNWYIRLNRRRYWGGNTGALTQDATQAYETLFHVLLQFSKIMAPYAPFTSDRIYRDLTDGLKGVPASVHLTDMPKVDTKAIDIELEERMSLVRKVAELGRSLRAKHQIKTRQVLPSLLIITRKESDRALIEKSKHLIASELNVKEVQFSSEEARYVRLGMKPNLKTLGKKLGAKLNELKKDLEAKSANQADVAQFLGSLEENGKVAWQGVDLELEDFLIDRGPLDERLIATERGVTVLLDTTLTDELVAEGLARELINRIQKLRKDSGLQVTDRIKLTMNLNNKLLQAAGQHLDYIKNETLAQDALFHRLPEQIKHRELFDIDGLEAEIGLERA